jgi:uncharacterized protein (TIGR03067 family)
MNWIRGAAVAVLAAVFCAAADKPGQDLRQFQGTWSVESIIRDGVAVPDDQTQRLVLVVKDNERMVKDGDEVKSKATFTVNVATSPKEMDITVSDGPLAGKTLRGIYELKDDTLTICLTLEGAGRPGDLTAKEGSGRLLQVYKKSDGKAAPAVKLPDLRTELIARRKADQGGRLTLLAFLRKHGGKPEGEAAEEFQGIVAQIHETDEKNTAILKATIEKHGWPGIALVGKDGAEAAFALAQHCRDADLQKKCLKLLADAVKAKDASPMYLAYLTDRVKVAAGEKQVYGTELEEKDGTVVPAPIADETTVDARRKEVGLPPLAESLKQARQDRGLPDKK